MQVNDVKQGFSSIQSALSEYKDAIKERKDTIKQATREIEELESIYNALFIQQNTEANILEQNSSKGYMNYDIEHLRKAIIEVVTQEPNLLAGQIHKRIRERYKFNALEETVRRRLKELVKRKDLEKTDPESRRNVRYRLPRNDLDSLLG